MAMRWSGSLGPKFPRQLCTVIVQNGVQVLPSFVSNVFDFLKTEVLDRDADAFIHTSTSYPYEYGDIPRSDQWSD